MSAIICGKRSFFEDIESAGTFPTSESPPPYKKFRCSSAASPFRFNYSPPVNQNLVDQLVALYPDMEIQLLEKALEESGNDTDYAIKSLQTIRLGNAKFNSGSTAEETAHVEKGMVQTGVNVLPSKEPQNNLPVDGAEWVDLFVREMMSATSIDGAKSCAANILENLEKFIAARASAETTQNYQKENLMLREQIEILMRDNVILKRAVAIQHERQKGYGEKNQEGHQLKQLVAQYQEQIRNLEVSKYALSMHLHQAQQNNTIPGRLNPDVF